MDVLRKNLSAAKEKTPTALFPLYYFFLKRGVFGHLATKSLNYLVSGCPKTLSARPIFGHITLELEEIMHSITLDHDGDDAYCHNWSTLICITGLRQHISLPRKAPRQIRLVFTRTPTQGEDMFKMHRPSWDDEGGYIDIISVNNYLLSTFRRMLRNEWQAGNRYFYFTFDEV